MVWIVSALYLCLKNRNVVAIIVLFVWQSLFGRRSVFLSKSCEPKRTSWVTVSSPTTRLRQKLYWPSMMTSSCWHLMNCSLATRWEKKTPPPSKTLTYFPILLCWQVQQGTISSWSLCLKSFREITVSFSTSWGFDSLLNVFDVWRMMTGLELMLSMPTYLPGNR